MVSASPQPCVISSTSYSWWGLTNTYIIFCFREHTSASLKSHGTTVILFTGMVSFFSSICCVKLTSLIAWLVAIVYLYYYYYYCVLIIIFIVAENFSKLCWKISYSGNDSRRISKFFDRLSTCKINYMCILVSIYLLL